MRVSEKASAIVNVTPPCDIFPLQQEHFLIHEDGVVASTEKRQARTFVSVEFHCPRRPLEEDHHMEEAGHLLCDILDSSLCVVVDRLKGPR
jgi:hypothetical protein